MGCNDCAVLDGCYMQLMPRNFQAPRARVAGGGELPLDVHGKVVVLFYVAAAQ